MRTLMLSPGVPLKQLAPMFGLSLSGLNNAIGADRFPVPTFLSGGRRYADRQVVRDFFAARTAEGLAVLAAQSKNGERT